MAFHEVLYKPKLNDGSTSRLCDVTCCLQRTPYPVKNGCSKASLTLIRLAGSNINILSSKSTNEVKSLRSSSFIRS